MSHMSVFMYKLDRIFRHSLHNHSIIGISFASTDKVTVKKREKRSYLELYYLKLR